MKSGLSSLPIMLALLALGFAGCNGETGYVEGTVTLDGQPIDQATVTFYPEEGRASLGRTDSAGKYKLLYTSSLDGAVIGEHKVTISTKVDAEVEYGDSDYENDEQGKVKDVNLVTKARNESMPLKYRDRKKTVLTATVTSGSNTIDFELTTEEMNSK